MRIIFLITAIVCSSHICGQQNNKVEETNLSETLTTIIDDARNCFRDHRGDSIQTNGNYQAFMSNIRLYGSKGLITSSKNHCELHYEYSKINMTRRDAIGASKRINTALKGMLRGDFKFKTAASNEYDPILGYSPKGYDFTGEEKSNSVKKSGFSYRISVDFQGQNFDFQVMFYMDNEN